MSEIQHIYEAGIYNPDDSIFVIKSIADVVTAMRMLESMQAEVDESVLIVWRPNGDS